MLGSALSRLLGYSMDKKEYDRLWSRMQDEFSNLFFLNGLRLLRAIASLSPSSELRGPSKPFETLLDGVKQSIRATGIGGGRCEEVAQAVVDLFSERDSEAFSWLTDLAVKYVSLCSLGLDASAQREVIANLQSIDLIVDTDVVLSFLSEGERPHQAVKELLERWRKLGGTVLVTPPVLEESAYHAWMSDFEYRDVWKLLSQLKPEEVPRYVKTAFVRGFYRAANGNYSRRRWEAYVSEYRGSEPTDCGKIEAILADEGFTLLKEWVIDAAFAKQVCDAIYAIREMGAGAYVPKQVGDKVARDGRLVAFLKKCREARGDGLHTAIILSSSQVLQRAANRFPYVLGEPAPVWPIGALAYMISLVPGVSMTLSVVRNSLFDEGDSEGMDQVARLALRVIRASTQYELGYSRRPTLKRALMREIERCATQRGEKPADFARELVSGAPETEEVLTEIIANSVDKMAASKHEKELGKLRSQLKERHGS